jgi:lipopolysaccharide transport protein LptA
MKKITATFFKTAKLEKDINVVGDSGVVSSNFYNFDIRGHARISSSDFSLSSQSFYLQNRELLLSKEGVDFKLKNISGQAAAGMEYYINLPVLKLFQCQGTMDRNGQPFDFRTQTLWVIKKDNLLVLQKGSELAGAEGTARSDWMSMQFDQGFVHLQSVSNFGNCFFSMKESTASGRSQSKEISADFIRLDYDPDGRLRQITVHGSGAISLQDQKNNGRLVSEITHIFLRSENQTLERVQTLTRGTLTSRGRDNVTVSGDALSAFYSPDGLLVEVKAQENCEFSAEGFQGTAQAFKYDAALFLIDITGKDATIVRNKNSFNSSHFQIHSRQRLLNAEKGVKATVTPGGKRVLLSSKPLFITAGAMEMTDKGDLIRFRDKVKLFQDDVELHAAEMLFDNLNNRMSFSGNADLKFINDNELLVLHGQMIFFNTAERKIVITGNASLNQAENVLSGGQIELNFDRSNLLETILARDNVTFSKEDLSGKSGLLQWYFNKKTVVFKNSAQISRKNGGTTKGKELLLNLISKEIKVSSQDDRAETIINQGRP